jgi:MYXO-CTERM domain-containing protein
MESGLLRPEVTIDATSAPFFPGQALPESISYSWRVDGGFWHQYVAGDKLVVRDPMLVLPGAHTIEVRARGAFADGRLVAGEPVKIGVFTDPEAPTLKLERDGQAIALLGEDSLDTAAELRYRWRAELTDGQPGAWSAWSADARVELHNMPLPPVFRVEAQVMDRAGHIATARELFSDEAPVAGAKPAAGEPSTFGCAAAPGQQRPGAAGALLAMLGMAGLMRRRRGSALLSALIGLVGLGSVACSDDGSANQNKTKTCEPACGADQRCADGVCVALPTMCMGDSDCGVGERCLGNQCAKTACEADATCEAICPDGYRGVCASGGCACEELCAAGCGDGQFCCESSDSCKAVPNACDGKTCEPGFEPKVVSEGTVNNMSCGLDGAQCDCAPLAPLPLGYHGRWLDVAEGGGVRAVSAYNQTYGDLMVGVITGQDLTFSFVDGAPDTGAVTGGIDGPRKGIAEPGANVGTHTALAISDDGTLHVLYRDVDNKSLKYARGTKKGATYDFTNATLDTNGEPALWTDAVLKDGVLHVVYMAPQVQKMAGGWAGELRYLALDPAKAPSEQTAEPRVLLSGGAMKPCGADCANEQQCFTGVGECRALDTSCAAACAEGFGCLAGACEPTFNTAAPLAQAPVAAQFMELTTTPTGLLLVFYDHQRGEVGWMRYAQNAWEAMPQYLGKPSGPYASGLVDNNGVLHLAYMVEAAGGALVYEQLGQGVREVIIDGLRDTGAEWLMARVGEDVHLRLDGQNRAAVVFQDATLHQLRAATRTAAGQWMPQTLAEPGMTYSGARGFYAGALRTSGPSLALEYIINNQAQPVGGSLVAHPLP